MCEKPMLVVLRGYPASGKSTWASCWREENPQDRLVLCRDSLRAALYGRFTDLGWEAEQNVSRVIRERAAEALRAGVSVVLDACHLRVKHVREAKKLADACDAEFELRDMLTSVGECVANDRTRECLGGRAVGEESIRELARRFPQPFPPVDFSGLVADWSAAKYVPDETLTEAYIFDLDGTLAHIDPDNPRSVYDGSAAISDLVDGPLADIAACLSRTADILITTGRPETYRYVAEAWLRFHAIPYTSIFCRPDGDVRKDAVVKRELFFEQIAPWWNVRAVFDDRDQVVDMWRQAGVPCYQVAEGDF